MEDFIREYNKLYALIDFIGQNLLKVRFTRSYKSNDIHFQCNDWDEFIHYELYVIGAKKVILMHSTMLTHYTYKDSTHNKILWQESTNMFTKKTYAIIQSYMTIIWRFISTIPIMLTYARRIDLDGLYSLYDCISEYADDSD